MLECPECGVLENHPTLKNKVCIRVSKVFDATSESHQCLRCSGAWNQDLTEYNQDNHDSSKGWFDTPYPAHVTRISFSNRLGCKDFWHKGGDV